MASASRIVLGLRYKVGSNVGLIAALARNDNFSRSGEHIDRAIKCDQALGGCDIEVSRPYDLIDARNAGGPICQRPDGMPSTAEGDKTP